VTEIKLWNNLETETTNGVGWVQVWINGEKKLTLGSDHTGKEIVVDTGSQKIIAIGVSYFVTSTKSTLPDQISDVAPPSPPPPLL